MVGLVSKHLSLRTGGSQLTLSGEKMSARHIACWNTRVTFAMPKRLDIVGAPRLDNAWGVYTMKRRVQMVFSRMANF